MGENRRYKVSGFRFGQSALTLREKTGLTQIEVADALGISRRAIQHWESGTAYLQPGAGRRGRKISIKGIKGINEAQRAVEG